MKKTEEVMRYYIGGNIEERKERIEEYLGMLRKRRIWGSLTSVEGAVKADELVVDSLGVLDVLRFDEEVRAVDIGAGGGILGIALAIACPAWSVTLIESSRRKCAFLAETAGALGLMNTDILNSRVEEAAGRVTFEVALSRAAGRIARLATDAVSLLERGGMYVALKSADSAVETEEAAAALPGVGARLREVISPSHQKALGMEDRVALVVIDKM